MASSADAESAVIRLCHRNLDVAGVQRQVLRALRRVVPADAAFLATADPATLLLTAAFSEEPLAAEAPRLLDNEYGGGDVNTFAALATSARHVASLDGATRRDRFGSDRYREIMRPLGLGDELRVALVAGSECWGYLCLHRADGPTGFSPRETALLARLGPHLGHALRQAILRRPDAAPVGAPRPGVLVLDGALELVASTPDAEHLLSLLDAASAARPLPVAVYAVASTLTGIERGTARPGALPSATVRTGAGHWLNVHASRLVGPPGEDRIAVVVEPAPPRATTPLLLSAHGLTPRESEVARLVLRGASTRAVADTMHISVHTVQDHLKAVFDKTGVRSRRELIGRLLGPAGAR